MTEPLAQCVAWLDAYFHAPSTLPELPVPALHHPVFQQGQSSAPRRAPFREGPDVLTPSDHTAHSAHFHIV